MRIQGSVVVITGASSGIGEELALAMARRGAKVGLTARREELLRALAEKIQGQGGTAAYAVADAADHASTDKAISALKEALGRIDILVANAGVGLTDSALRFSADRFRTMVAVNLLGAADAFEAVLPGMIERRRGQIVGISSLAAFRGLPGSVGYSATKAGLSALLEGFRPELRKVGVEVTTVHPGFVTTPMIAGAKHPKPFEMSAARAAEIIARGIERGRSRVDFPWPMVMLLSVVRLLPNWVYDPLVARSLPERG
jgi:short-subunit dehydrogenase